MAPPPPDILNHESHLQLAAALRARVQEIMDVWSQRVREAIPAVRGLTSAQLLDSLPVILPQIAEALGSLGDDATRGLMAASPAQGATRFRQQYEMRDLMTEDRFLRQVITEQAVAELGRPMTGAEQVALGVAVDLMLQQSVLAFFELQKAQLRAAAEAELKYLSFLSHDLNNNLGSVTLMLQVLRQRLDGLPEFAEDVETLDDAQRSILETIGGMGRLLQSERLRKAGVRAERHAVDLHRLALAAAQQVSVKANAKGVAIVSEVAPGTSCDSDAELIGLVLQNLVSNAVKYSRAGTVRIRGVPAEHAYGLAVSDEGPGIAVEHIQRIFSAFRRGEGHGEPGVGLGLTIASQAAKLLGGTLTVTSSVGVGSTFTLTLPRELQQLEAGPSPAELQIEGGSSG